MISLHELYGYVFGDFAKIDVSKAPADKQETIRQAREEQIRAKFAFLEGNNKKYFRALLRQLHVEALEIILYGNTSDPLESKITNKYDDLPFQTDKDIEDQFDDLEKEYKYFPNDVTAKNKYIMFYKACMLTADYIECDNEQADDDIAIEHAYKILVLFGETKSENPFREIENHIKISNLADHPEALTKALDFPLPVNDPAINLNFWQKFVSQRHRATAFFQYAAQLSQKLNVETASIDEVEAAAAQIKYKRYGEYPELARLCLHHNVKEEDFDKCLEVEKTRKKTDTLPDVVIDGADVGHPGYFLLKLPVDDPRAYLLGEIVNNCQSIGENGERYVREGMRDENKGFYVLVKGSGASPYTADKKINYEDFQIVGEAYAWWSTSGNLVFDSWENLRPKADDAVIVPILEKFSAAVIKQHESVMRVTVGTGGVTPIVYQSNVAWSEVMPHYEGYYDAYGSYDSYMQSLVLVGAEKQKQVRTRVLETFKALREKYSFIPAQDVLEASISDEQMHSTRLPALLSELFVHPDYQPLWEGISEGVKQQLPDYIAKELIPQIHHLVFCLQQIKGTLKLSQEKFDKVFVLTSGFLNTVAVLAHRKIYTNLGAALFVLSSIAEFQPEIRKILYYTLKSLSKISIFTYELVNFIVSRPLEAKDVVALINELLERKLDLAIVKEVIAVPEKAQSLAKAYLVLLKLDMFIDENRRRIKLLGEELHPLSFLMEGLAEINLLDQKMLNSLLEPPVDKIFLIGALVTGLKEFNMLSPDTYILVMAKPVIAIYILGAMGLLKFGQIDKPEAFNEMLAANTIEEICSSLTKMIGINAFENPNNIFSCLIIVGHLFEYKMFNAKLFTQVLESADINIHKIMACLLLQSVLKTTPQLALPIVECKNPDELLAVMQGHVKEGRVAQKQLANLVQLWNSNYLDQVVMALVGYLIAYASREKTMKERMSSLIFKYPSELVFLAGKLQSANLLNDKNFEKVVVAAEFMQYLSAIVDELDELGQLSQPHFDLLFDQAKHAPVLQLALATLKNELAKRDSKIEVAQLEELLQHPEQSAVLVVDMLKKLPSSVSVTTVGMFPVPDVAPVVPQSAVVFNPGFNGG